MRPASLLLGGTIYWVIRTYDPDSPGVLKDADSTPAVAIRKNGSAVGDSVTIAKRSAATGIYDCSYDPAGEAEGDQFTVEESAAVTGTTTASATYSHSWAFMVAAVERGTDGANTVAPATPQNVDDAEAAILAAILNTVPLDPPTFTRSTADEKPIQFSWINGTDTLTATRSIDGGAFEAVAGAIAFFRNENSVAQYTLAYNAADRPTEEGTVRYKVTNGAITVVLTLRVEEPGGGAATIGDWAITRTFQVAGGDKVSGVRMSLVGVSGKTDTSGSDGIAIVKTDDGTFTLRVVVPAGYEDVADTSVTINGADDTATVTLVATSVTIADAPLCNVLLPVIDQHGSRIAGIDVEIMFASFAAGADPTAVVVNPRIAIKSDANGLVERTLLRLGKYSASYTPPGQTPRRVSFTVPNAGSYVVVEPIS